LIHSIEDWIVGGRQGPHPKYQATPVELTPVQGNVVLEPEPTSQQTFFIKDQTANPAGLMKKGRKRPKKKDYASCQTAQVLDKIPTQEQQYHVVGEPMVSWEST
jgi:hypothetical protein